MIENLRKECHAKFCTKDESNALRKRIEALEEDMHNAQQDLSNQSVSLNACRDITDTNKLDIDELKRLIKDLKNSRQTSSGSSLPDHGSSINSKDLDDLMKRLKVLEEDMKNKVNLADFKNEIFGLREMIGNLEPDEHAPV